MGVSYRPSKIEPFPKPIVGTVDETIARDHPGRVKCIGTIWPAKFYEPEGGHHQSISPGMEVKIIARQGIDMLVVPLGLA
jgi:membrane protein implicated in regulation of membrane protease activity